MNDSQGDSSSLAISLSQPEMSVVILTRDRYDAIRKTIRHLKAQTVSGKLEIVIVAPSRAGLQLNEAELRVSNKMNCGR